MHAVSSLKAGVGGEAVAATVWYERAAVVTLGRGALWGAMLLAALQWLDGLHHAVCNGGLQWGHKPASYLHIFISARTCASSCARSDHSVAIRAR